MLNRAGNLERENFIDESCISQKITSIIDCSKKILEEKGKKFGKFF